MEHYTGEAFCAPNQLTTLDVRQNAALKELSSSYNLFTDRSAIKGLNESMFIYFDFDPQGSQILQP